jgi:hypothetical protein
MGVSGIENAKPTASQPSKAWSEYTKADYTPEQWHAACLIHQHSGPPTSKDQCKLPVKTPSGTLHRGGVIAAAGSLAGARGGVQASPSEKSKAAKTLLNHYNTLSMPPPPGLKGFAHSDISGFLEHHGIKGMKWGVRRGRSSPTGPTKVVVQTKTSPNRKTSVKTQGGEAHPAHGDAIAARKAQQKLKKSGSHSLSNSELQRIATRLNLEQQVTRLTPPSGLARVVAGRKFARDLAKGPEGKLAVQGVKAAAKSKRVRRAAAKVAVTAALA